jgi:hypothetical protein
MSQTPTTTYRQVSAEQIPTKQDCADESETVFGEQIVQVSRWKTFGPTAHTYANTLLAHGGPISDLGRGMGTRYAIVNVAPGSGKDQRVRQPRLRGLR